MTNIHIYIPALDLFTSYPVRPELEVTELCWKLKDEGGIRMLPSTAKVYLVSAWPGIDHNHMLTFQIAKQSYPP